MERNITLDYFKLFLSVLVIIIHTPLIFSGNGKELSEWLIHDGITRIAVPCFFIINGYFIGEQILDGKFVKKYATRLLFIYIVWTTIYCVNFYDESIRRLFVFCLTGYLHLWYVVALIAGTVILYFFKKTGGG
jgi:surface polysaccharide O-acyltransferase-like enzyme